MLFNSYIFIFLLWPIAFLGYFIFNKYQKYDYAKIFLVACSFWFYGSFRWEYLFILIFSILFNYLLNILMSREQRKPFKKLYLSFGLFVNIALIFVFKYYDFFVDTTNMMFGTHLMLYHIALPLGISFFTFQQISFIMDSYRNSCVKVNFLDYTLFVSFFPQLIAGPIVLQSEMIPQFAKIDNKRINYSNLTKAITYFAIGLSKKVLLADTFGLFVDSAYADVSSLNATESLLAMLAFVFQIYFDFSGYCDMAIGIGYSFNIKIPINFNSPYKSISIVEFWKRWHITLGRFLTWYIYIPLSISKSMKNHAYINILIIFLISGIWHGAGWTYIVFGLLFGVVSVAEHIFERTLNKIPKFFRWIYTFAVICVASAIFRSTSISEALSLFSNIFIKTFGSVSQSLLNSFDSNCITAFISMVIQENSALMMFLILLFIFSFWLVLKAKNSNEIVSSLQMNNKVVIINVILLLVSIMSLTQVSRFLYFNF